MPAVDVTYAASVTPRQRELHQRALTLTRFAIGSGDLQVTVQRMDEPPCPGHSDYMCTSAVGIQAVTTIRTGAEDPDQPFNLAVQNDLDNFFMESCIHELGHAFYDGHNGAGGFTQDAIANWFIRKDRPSVRGTMAMWNPLDAAWADRVAEGFAEFFKDLFMPEQYRHYQNRSNWTLDRAHFGDFMTWVEATTCPNG